MGLLSLWTNPRKSLKSSQCFGSCPVYSKLPNKYEWLDVYMHILQLLTTVDDGIQAIVHCPDTGKDIWNLLFDLVCHEFCQSDDPPIILQEQKTVLASVFSVLSAIYASQTEQEYLKIEKVDLPLIDSLIRVLQNMEQCQKKPENSTESNTEETKKTDLTQDDFHLKILKDILCEFLSNIFQALTKETVAQGVKEGQLSKQKCSSAFQNLLPFYSPVISLRIIFQRMIFPKVCVRVVRLHFALILLHTKKPWMKMAEPQDGNCLNL
uniref:Serum amyloid A like 1 n=2 Tax=Cercopithecinae TaxID=9528 RepID=A0A2K5L8J0_CERAT